MGECFVGFLDTLGICNISECPNAVDEISKVNDSNTTYVEREDDYASTLLYLLLRLMGYIGIMYATYIVGYKYGIRRRYSDILLWANEKIFNPGGAALQMVAGQPVIQPIPQYQRPKPMKIKKKKKFIPPMYNPPSRTPHIPIK